MYKGLDFPKLNSGRGWLFFFFGVISGNDGKFCTKY